MQVKLLRRRYYAHDYGGRLFTETQRAISIDLMYVRGLVNQIEGTRCP
jgi:hypothetical protein